MKRERKMDGFCYPKGPVQRKQLVFCFVTRAGFCSTDFVQRTPPRELSLGGVVGFGLRIGAEEVYPVRLVRQMAIGIL